MNNTELMTMMNQAMGQAMGHMKDIHKSVRENTPVTWVIEECASPMEIANKLNKYGQVVSVQIFVFADKIYMLFGRV